LWLGPVRQGLRRESPTLQLMLTYRVLIQLKDFNQGESGVPSLGSP
jgi:hypothetical protein